MSSWYHTFILWYKYDTAHACQPVSKWAFLPFFWSMWLFLHLVIISYRPSPLLQGVKSDEYLSIHRFFFKQISSKYFVFYFAIFPSRIFWLSFNSLQCKIIRCLAKKFPQRCEKHHLLWIRITNVGETILPLNFRAVWKSNSESITE